MHPVQPGSLDFIPHSGSLYRTGRSSLELSNRGSGRKNRHSLKAIATVRTALVCVDELDTSMLQGLEYSFQPPETSFTHTAHTCRSPFLGALYATRGDRGRSRHRNRYNGSAATATAHVRVHLTAHARIKPPSVPNASTCREHEPPDDSKSMRRKQCSRWQSGPQDRRSAASVRLSGGLASTAASTRRFAVMPTSRPLCFRPPSCCSHHLPQSTSQTVA